MKWVSGPMRRVILAGLCVACIGFLYAAGRYLSQREVQPLSLALADINLDGFPDLVTGHAGSGRGLITLHLGNPETFAPTRQETIQAIANGQQPNPFLSDTTVLETPDAPDFLAAGDFDRDGHLDILTAARGGSALHLLPGDGRHGFRTSRAVPLPGRLTAMTTGQKTQTDDWPDVVVGIVGENGPALIVYHSKYGVLADSAEVSRLPAAATEVALGRLDEDRDTDLAIVAGNRLLVLHGSNDDATGEATSEDEEGGAGYLEPIALPFGVNAVALSDFIWDRDARMELAVAGDDGPVRIIARGPLDTRPLTADEVLARRRLVEAVRRGERPSSDLTPPRPYLAPTWQVAETIGTKSSQGAGGHRLLVSTLGSGRQAHDLLILDPGAAVAALPMRVSVHAVPGLVVLRPGDSEPVVQGQADSHVAFNVNTAADTDDASAGNGVCADSGNNCSLRAAIQEANAHAGADMITFSPALNGLPIQLTQVGDDNTAAQGDLDINSDITIVGNGAANTIIQGSSSSTFASNMGDKVFGINQDGTFSTLNVSISGLTVRFTRNSNPTAGTFTETGGALDIFLTGTGAMPGPTTTITNCTFDSNANQNSYGGAINIDSGDLMGGTNIFRGTVQITGSTISNNDTLNTAGVATGGGINLFADRHNVTFTNTTITGNQTSANIGSNGGGINIRHSNGGTVALNTNTITSNISGSDGGGIMIAGVGGQTVNMTGGSLSGNTAQGTGASADGGGIFNANPVGSTTLSGVTISNNTATAGTDARGGGVEDGANSPMTINNCTITGNSSDNGGGVATTNAFVNQLTTITNSTISGNSATTAGGGLFILSGAMTANLNRIVNNTAPSGSGIAQTGGTASVENNWWQCDGFPNAAGCQTGSGTFDADPRVDLRLLPASTTLAPGGTQTFTANVSQNTNGAAINPVVLNGLTVTFGGGGLGSVSPGSAALANLAAATLFTASSTCPNPNTGNVSATLDNGTQTSLVTVQVAPQISACPANQVVNTDPGLCTALASFTPPTATAGCPVPTVSTRIGATLIFSPHAFPVGTSTVTSTASNGVAPDASCSFTVTVNDAQNPAISCPANITSAENPPGSGAAVVTYAAPVGTDACPGATTVQTAGLPSGNAFPVGVTTNTFRTTDAAGNTATCSFTVTVTTPPDLTIAKSHTGNFVQGQTGATYTLNITNVGGAATSGTVTLADTVPTGLTPTAAAGTGWVCTTAGASVNCSRSDALGAGSSYPPITLPVDVAPNAPASLTNTATISGGGDVNTANNSASDVTTIVPGPDLIIAKSHAGNFIQGQTGAQFTLTVTNNGGTATSGAVTLADTVPTGLTPTAAAGTGWTCGITGQTVSCTRNNPLAPTASYEPVTLTVNVAPNAPPSVTNTATVSGGGDGNTTNNTATDVTTILPGPDLIISKSHAGNFVQGQTGAQFTVTVTNSGGSPTSGLVTLMDNVPAGFTPTAASGAGWICGMIGALVSCTRSDPLAPGASYAAVTITVNVAPTAPSSLTNTATIAGGGDINATNNTASDVVTITPGLVDLATTKTDGRTTYLPGGPIVYTIVVTNAGPSNANGFSIVDAVPATITAVAVGCAVTGAGSCGVNGSVGNSVSFSGASLTAGAGNSLTLTVRGTVSSAATGDLVNTAIVTAGAGSTDTNPANNTATDTDRPISASTPTEIANFFAYDPAFTGGVSVAAGDVDGDGVDDIVTGAGPGGGPHVQALTVTGRTPVALASYFAYDPAFMGGVSVAVGDVNGDGVDDIVTGGGAGGGPHVRAISLAGGSPTELASFFAYSPAFTGGVRVAVGDVDGDGVDDIVTGAGAGAGPHVRAFSGVGGALTELASFFAYDPSFTGGVSVAVGDVNGDGVDDIVTGAGIGAGPHVRAFGVAGGSLTELASFFAYDPAFLGGVNVAVGDLDGDGVDDIITAAGLGAAPHVRAFSMAAGGPTEIASFFAFDPAFTGGVFVAAGDVNRDGIDDIITGSGPGGPAQVRAFSLESEAAVEPQERDP